MPLSVNSPSYACAAHAQHCMGFFGPLPPSMVSNINRGNFHFSWKTSWTKPPNSCDWWFEWLNSNNVFYVGRPDRFRHETVRSSGKHGVRKMSILIRNVTSHTAASCGDYITVLFRNHGYSVCANRKIFLKPRSLSRRELDDLPLLELYPLHCYQKGYHWYHMLSACLCP